MSYCTGEPQILCRRRQGWNRQSGDYVEVEYAGMKDAIYGLIAEAKNRGAENIDIDHEGARYTFKARFNTSNDGASEAPVDEVRLGANRVAVDIYNHPNFAGISVEAITDIRTALQENDILSAASFTAEDIAAGALDLYDLILSGVQHFIVNQPVLVRTRVASGAFAFNQPSPYANVGSIIGVFSIDADAALGGILRTVLPTDTTGTNSLYAVGWLKHYPEYNQAAGNKGVLTQEYEFGKWSRAMYGDPI